MTDKKFTPFGKRHNYELRLGQAICLNCGKVIRGDGASMAALSDQEECPGRKGDDNEQAK